jgi:tubulin--tyrosine ligase-like protein 12
MDKLWMYAGTYRIVSEDQMDEENIWYINDEVGCAMRHSDAPNFAIHPFIYAPNNKFDAHTITYSVCWPLKDIAEGETIYKDYLKGIDESKFRSARFTVWFNTPEEYFSEQLSLYRVSNYNFIKIIGNSTIRRCNGCASGIPREIRPSPSNRCRWSCSASNQSLL